MKKLGFFQYWQKIFAILFLVAYLFLSPSQENVFANEYPKDRTITTKIESTLYEWWLVYWSNNSVACDFFVEHEGNPTDLEIQSKCSVQLHQSWSTSPPCENSTNSYSTNCSGLYLHLASTTPVQKEVEIKFALPSVRLSLIGCEYQENQDYCFGSPSLTFNGLEPIPNEVVNRLHGTIGRKPFNSSS